MKQLATSFSTSPEGEEVWGDRVNLGGLWQGRMGQGRSINQQDDLFQTQPYLLEDSVPSQGMR